MERLVGVGIEKGGEEKKRCVWEKGGRGGGREGGEQRCRVDGDHRILLLAMTVLS